MFGSANSVSDGPTCASLELLLQAADIISKREQAGEPVAERVVPNDRLAAKLAYIVAYDSAMSTGSESSDNGSDSDNGAVPSRASQNKPYKRPATSKRKHQQSKKLALAERLDKSDAQLKGAAMHNEVEKRRRAYLSHCYSALKLAVPGLEKSKASNVTVLRSAVDEIKKLEETGRQLEAAKAEQYRLRETLLKALPAHFRLQYPTTPPPLSEAYDDSEDTAAVPDSEDQHISDSEQDMTTSSIFAYSTALPPHLPIKESSFVPASCGQDYAQRRGGGARRRKATA